MITLCGTPISNYYNKVKMALIEKEIDFVEETVHTHSRDEAVLAASPLAKIPFVRTSRGCLCESQVVLDYLEDLKPTPALLPADPFERAKVREITTFVDLHLELLARELYGPAFFGAAPLDEATVARLRKRLVKHIAGFKRLARFAPYVAGTEFTQADCAAFNHLPLISMATRAVCGEDLLVAAGVEWKAYIAMVGERDSAKRVVADRKAAQAALPKK